jgi:hypothetical protein
MFGTWQFHKSHLYVLIIKIHSQHSKNRCQNRYHFTAVWCHLESHHDELTHHFIMKRLCLVHKAHRFINQDSKCCKSTHQFCASQQFTLNLPIMFLKCIKIKEQNATKYIQILYKLDSMQLMCFEGQPSCKYFTSVFGNCE